MDKAELYYDVAKSHLLEQDDRSRQLDWKASGILGIGATLVGFSGIVIDDWTYKILPGLIIVSIGFAVAAGSALFALHPKTFDRRPSLGNLAKYLHEKGEAGEKYGEGVMTEWAADSFSDSVADNDVVLAQKATQVKVGTWFLTLEVVGLAVLIGAVLAESAS